MALTLEILIMKRTFKLEYDEEQLGMMDASGSLYLCDTGIDNLFKPALTNKDDVRLVITTKEPKNTKGWTLAKFDFCHHVHFDGTSVFLLPETVQYIMESMGISPCDDFWFYFTYKVKS